MRLLQLKNILTEKIRILKNNKDVEQENKDLLLRDLCGRLQYGVILQCCGIVGERLCSIDDKGLINNDYDIEEVKPYLFPMSAMTEEQKEEISKRYNYHNYYEGLCIEITNHSEGYWDDDNSCHLQDYLWLEDWLNKNHFDYRGLIDMGLALDATNLNIY